MNEVLLQYGILGVCVIAMGGFIVKIINDSRRERKEMLDKLTDLTEDTNKVLRDHTNVLAGLKTLLENQKR